MITYTTDPSGLEESDLEPFFVGWTKRPTTAQALEMLHAAHGVVLARETTA